MKKLLVAFVLGFSVFAGFAQASEILKCEWKKTNPELQKVCIEARNLQISARKWAKITDADEKIRGACFIDSPCEYALPDDVLKDRAKKVYGMGFVNMYRVAKSNSTDNVNDELSNLEKEKMFMEAIDYFKQAEKLARKPVIHSGGILPGPKSEEDGESYFANKFLTKVINGALVILFSAGTLILIIGGIMFLISSGEEEMKTKAKDTIFWGIVGIVIAVMAYAIVKFVVGLDFGF